MKIILFILSTTLIIFYSCKKDKDVVALHTINGMVFNNCTDSGLANVTVFLNTKDGKGTSSSQTTSDSNGNFTFTDVSIHSSSKYSYAIYIPSKSGENATTFEYCGFEGTTLNFNNDEADMFFKPRVRPSFLNFTIYCNPTLITTQNDTIIFHAYQYIFKKNRPTDVYTWGGGVIGTFNSPNNFGNYAMGKYNLEIDIWKSGVHTTRKDSVYLGWGSNTTYTINW